MRLAANSLTLSDFAAGWTDEHNLAQPLTGAIFDILVDVFHEHLLDRSLISPEVEDLADQLEYRPEYEELIHSLFADAYAQDPQGFKMALLETRDTLGLLLAGAWSRLSPHFLNYDDVGDALLAEDPWIAFTARNWPFLAEMGPIPRSAGGKNRALGNRHEGACRGAEKQKGYGLTDRDQVESVTGMPRSEKSFTSCELSHLKGYRAGQSREH